ncbi:MAG: PDZ domain-containing protein [Planctomycetia bacterium]|nr:PDZ domain-containing protein [Planctomycetia bacterium]
MPLPALDDLELALQSPRATGVFLVEVRPGSPAAAAGFAPGDIVTHAGGAPTPDLGAFLKAVQGGGKGDVRLKGVRHDGGAFEVEVAAGRIGVQGYAVQAGTCAWRTAPDCGDPPDLSAFAKPASWWFRTSFGTDRAGYERVHVSPSRGGVEFDHLTFFGGGEGKERWAYRAHVRSTHRLDAVLGTVAVDCVFGTKEEGQETARAALGPDGIWRGEAADSKGQKRAIEERPAAATALNTYSVPFLALTLPLRAGARRAFPELREGSAAVRCRSRLECLGREDVAVNGRTVPAWVFAWRHWGESPNFERFFVSDDRRLVRIEWGPDYAGCWCEAVTKAEAARGIPGHIRVE